MKKTKKNKGITLMSLVITIILLIILASIGTYSGVQVVKSAQFTAFSTELKIMQTQVNKLYEDKKNDNTFNEPGTIITGKVKEQADKVFTESASGIINSDEYKYYDTDTIKSLNVEGVKGKFFVNIDKRSVVSYEGFEYEGETYYTLDQLPDGLYNVEYNNTNNWDSSKDSFDIEYNEVEEGKYRITVSKQSNDYSFIIDEVGNYRVKIANNNTESNEKQIKANASLLPIEFQEVEYIESTGTQYIMIGEVQMSNIIAEIQYPGYPNNCEVIGGMNGTANNGRLGLGIDSSSLNFYFVYGNKSGLNSGKKADSKKHKYNLNILDSDNKTAELYIDNVYSYSIKADEVSNPLYFTLFAYTGWGKTIPNLFSNCRIYYFELEGQKKLYPCYRKSDNVKGMYDVINNRFYTNQGTGDFSKGNDSDGGETINTIIINNM